MRRGLLAEARWRGEALMNSRNTRPPCTAFQRCKSKCPASSSGCAEDKAQGCEEKMGSVQAKARALQMGDVTPQRNSTAWWSLVNEHLLDTKKHMASLQEEMSGVLGDVAFIRTDLSLHRAALEVSFSSLLADIKKRHDEQIMCITCQREHVSEDIKMLQDRMESHLDDIEKDLAMGRDVDKQFMMKTEEYRADVAEVRSDEDADVAEPYCHTKFTTASSIIGLSILKDRLTDIHAHPSTIKSGMHMLISELRAQRANLAKLICKVTVQPVISEDPLPSHVGTAPNTSMALEIKDILSQIDKNLKGLQEDFHRHANVGTPTTNENTFQLALFKKMETMNKVQSSTLQEMRADMERLCGVVATMNTSANGVWSDVLAQEKRNTETQEMLQKLLSFVESYVANKEHANVVLVKVVGAFLVCIIVLHAWTVWSFNSCYPL